MMKRFAITAMAFCAMLCASPTAVAQTDDIPKCKGPVYSTKEVTRRARITARPNYDAIYEAFGRDVQARAVLDVVLCRSGQVTDIKVVEVTPPGIAEFFVKAISILPFKQAELNWHTVSQRQRLEYQINYNHLSTIDGAAAAGRLVESIDIVGHRRLTTKQIFIWIQTRPGEPYSEELLRRDFDAVLATGYFDKLQSRVTIEPGKRGGIAVVFHVVELPLIGEINFDGLPVEQAKIIEALKKENVNLEPGTPYHPASVRKAILVIERFLASIGQGDFKVKTWNVQVPGQKVNITFLISPNQ